MIFFYYFSTEVEDFVDMVIEAVEKKTYLTSSSNAANNESDSSSKKSSSRHDRHRNRSPSSRHRSRSPRRSSKSDRRSDRSRHDDSRRKRSSRSRSPTSRHRQRSPQGNSNDSKTSSKVCPTFEKQGYCLEGESCPYTHPGFLQVEEKDIQAIAATYQAAAGTQPGGDQTSPNPTKDLNKNAHISPVLAQYLQMGMQQLAASADTPGQMQQQQMMPQPPFFPPGFNPMMAGAVEQNMMMQQQLQQQQRPMNRNLRQVRSFNARGGGGGGRNWNNHYQQQQQHGELSASQLDNEMDEIAQANAAARSGVEPPPSQHAQFDQQNRRGGYQQRGGFRGGRGRGGFRGGRGGYHQQNPQQRNSILEIRKVPANQNSIGPLHEHFSQFGPVSNIQVSYEGDPEAALITFNEHADALKAYRNPEPLFNNRFIRVFWHHKNDDMPQGNEQQQKPAGDSNVTSTPTQDQASQQQQQEQKEPGSEEQTAPPSKPPPRAKLKIDRVGEEKQKAIDAQNELQKKRRLMLANYLEMRKQLVEKLKNAGDENEAVKTQVESVPVFFYFYI